MGKFLSKLFKCIFYCCPDKNCIDREKREVEIIYNEIKQLDECFSSEII